MHDPHFDSEIQCELIETYLGDVPYEALSYTWGSMVKPSKITVDASKLHVTENLYTALQYLRLPYEDRLLWVDAICINQNSDEERGHQVGQMRLVYKMAEGVLIWLGTSDVHIDHFFEAMNDRRLKEMMMAGSDSEGIEIYPEVRAEFRHEFQGTFSKLMARPWFRRVWILQEVATGRKATVMCGRSSVSTRKFALVPTIIGFSIQEHCQAVLDIMPGQSRQLSWWGERQDLRTLLLKFAASEATDERDKIYALLGISSDAYNSKELVPNYVMDVQQLIHDTWSYILFNEVLDPSLHGFPKLNMSEFLQILNLLPEWTLEWSLREEREDIVLQLVGARGNAVSRKFVGKWALLCTLAGHRGPEEIFGRSVSDDKTNINVGDYLRDTPLHKAIWDRQLDKIEALLSRKDVLVNSENLTHETPLSRAVQLGQETMVNLLLSHPCTDVNYAIRGRTPIALAIQFGNRGIVKALLACRDIEINHDGFTPLEEAVKRGHSHILRQLLDSDLVDVNYRSDGTVAWTIALKARRQDIIAMLISDERVKKEMNENWQEYLEVAIHSGFTPAVEMVLMCKDADQNTCVRWKFLSLELEWWWGHLECTLYGSDNYVGYVSTPLFLSAMLGHEKTVAMLLKNGADIQNKGSEGCMSPLAVACMTEKVSMARLLLEHGASLDSQNRDGKTILELTERGSQIRRLLISCAKQPGETCPLN